MNFFKSVFSDETPQSPPSPDSQTIVSETSPNSSQSTTPKSPSSATTFGGGAWSFGGLIQTISSKSESVLETYRRDLQEFSDGLKSETQVLKHVAATSLDVGAAKAQVSLESVGLAIDSLGSAVSEIIFHSSDDQTTADHALDQPQSSVSRDVGVKYSRFESQLKAIQTDESTYVDDVIDEGERDEFEKFKLGFELGNYEIEVDDLLKSYSFELIYNRLVPSKVDRETFWLRYFYRVDRLKKAEFVRAKLVNRAIKGGVDDDEELSWDVDEEEDGNANSNANANVDNVEDVEDVDNVKAETISKEGDNVVVEEKEEVKGEVSEGSKDSDISVVSTQPSFREEEDMGWDEIEDVGSGDDEKKGGSSTTITRLESEDKEVLRKRLSVAEDDEDLTWDIEDDDEPIKS